MSDIFDVLTPIENELTGLYELLTAAGLSPERTETGYRCPVNAGPHQVGWSYLVSAQRILMLPEFKQDFSALQAELFDELYSASPRPSLYLYIVGTPEELAELDNSGKAYLMESNMNYAVKSLATMAELEGLLGGLFAVVPLARKANKAPQVRMLRELRDRVTDAAEPAYALSRFSRFAEFIEAELLQDNRGADRELVSQVYRRFMGRDFHLVWTPSGATFGRGGDMQGMPRHMASSGELAGYDMACFLMETARRSAPGLTIGLHGTLSSLDTLKQTLVLDVLRDFIAATGISVELQSANTTVLGLAKLKLKAVANLTGYGA